MPTLDPRDITVITVTVVRKEAWLRTMLDLLEEQTVHPAGVVVGVDVKRTQDPLPALGPRCFRVSLEPSNTISSLKQQHSIIDSLVRKCSTSHAIIQDDDYCFSHKESLRAMASAWRDGSVVVPSKFREIDLSKDTSSKPKSVTKLGWDEDVRTSRGRVPNEAWDDFFEPHPGVLTEPARDAGERSCLSYHSFWCGHPKLISIKDYVAAGGLRHLDFPHYWHCDTEMALRMLDKGLQPIAIDGLGVAHLNHPRGSHQLMKPSNEAKLIDEFPGWESRLLSRSYETVPISELIRPDAG